MTLAPGGFNNELKPQFYMLDAYIIQEIKKEESRKREAEERPRLHIEMPLPPWPRREEEDSDEEDDVADTVIHIDMSRF